MKSGAGKCLLWGLGQSRWAGSTVPVEAPYPQTYLPLFFLAKGTLIFFRPQVALYWEGSGAPFPDLGDKSQLV